MNRTLCVLTLVAGEHMVHAMSVDAPQGNAGMYIAVANSAC